MVHTISLETTTASNYPLIQYMDTAIARILSLTSDAGSCGLIADPEDESGDSSRVDELTCLLPFKF
jgi:hypothetical protein